MAKRCILYSKRLVKTLKRWLLTYWRKNWWNKLLTILAALLILSVGSMYGIAQWYIQSQANKPLHLGVSFIPDYAESLGLNPKQTMDALIHIGVRQFRLVSYWSDGEPIKGQYNFSQLDWEFKKAEAVHAKIILALGLRQPRWPECHIPTWAENEPVGVWEPQLMNYMKAVVNRYKNSPSLAAYQVENEYFLHGFGNCTNYSRNRLVKEYNLVKQLDHPYHPIIVSRSNNAIGIPIGQPQPDLFGISVYRWVWDANVTHRYLKYPWPAWYYGFLAGLQEIVDHKNMVIDELQAEAWPANGKTIPQVSKAELNKTMSAKKLQSQFNYGIATGMRSIDMWGAEYWYYRLVKLHDPSLWNVAKREFARYR